MTLALRLAGVRKRFGSQVALDGLDLDVRRGCLMGLVGPNGAGKTTTFAIVSGLLRADGGEVDVLGQGPFEPAVRAGDVGLVPQDCALPAHASARQLLDYYARLQGLTRAEAARETDRLLSAVQLSDRAKARVSELSHGMKRRLTVAQALLGDPKLVLLDEPTGGLDPHLVVAMRELLVSERRKRTLIISSHVLADLELTCDEVAFVEAGRCVRAGTLESLRVPEVRIRLAAPLDPEVLEALMEGREYTSSDEALTYRLQASESAADVAPEILAALTSAGARILEVRVGGTLEETYLASRETHADFLPR